MTAFEDVPALIGGGLLLSVAAGAAVAAALALGLRILRPNRAQMRFVSWFMALVALPLVVPVFVASGLHASQGVPLISIARDRAARNPVVVRAARLDAMPASGDSPAIDLEAAAPNTPAWHGAIVAAAGAWMAGTAIALLRVFLGLHRLRSMRRSATLLEMRASRRGPIAILNADAFSVPVALGYRRPAIVLPTSILALEREPDLDHVVAHEMEHLRRFDDLTSLAGALCLALVWFNPFARLIARQVAVEREMACDEAVVDRMGKRRRYAATLWKIAVAAGDARVPRLLPAFFSGDQTVARIDNLSRMRSPIRFSRGVLAALAIAQTAAVLGVAAAAAGALSAAPVASDFALVSLRGGDVIAIGGRVAGGRAIANAQIYDLTGRRTAIVPMHVGRWALTATVLPNGDVLVLGGMTDRGATGEAEIFSAATRTFRALPPMRVARAGHSSTLLPDGRVLVAAGEYGPGRYVATTELYDPRTGRSTFAADGATRIFQTALRIDDGSVLMFGGRDEHGAANCAIIFDPSHNGYRNAGKVVLSAADRIVFKLRTGQVIAHHILGA